MLQSHSPDEAQATLDPVWFNTQRIKDALGLYEGVSKHADQLTNAHHGYFFGLVQSISLDHAVLGICKLLIRVVPNFKKTDSIFV